MEIENNPIPAEAILPEIVIKEISKLPVQKMNIKLQNIKAYGMRNRLREAIDNSIKEVKHDEEKQKNKIGKTDNIQKE